MVIAKRKNYRTCQNNSKAICVNIFQGTIGKQDKLDICYSEDTAFSCMNSLCYHVFQVLCARYHSIAFPLMVIIDNDSIYVTLSHIFYAFVIMVCLECYAPFVAVAATFVLSWYAQ